MSNVGKFLPGIRWVPNLSLCAFMSSIKRPELSNYAVTEKKCTKRVFQLHMRAELLFCLIKLLLFRHPRSRGRRRH